MARAAAQIFQAADGWGTNEEAIHSALRGRSPAEIAAIRAEYQNHYGVSLDSVLNDELSGDDLEMANAALSADPVASAAASLVLASAGLGTDEDAIMNTLRGLSDPAQREAVAAEYERRTGESLSAMLDGELSSNTLAAANALAGGNPDEADAILLDDAMNGGFLGIGNVINTDEEGINTVLERCADQAQRDRVMAAYEARTGRSLRADLTENLDEGTEADLSSALLDGRAVDAAAIRIAAAAEGLGTDEEAIFQQLSVANPDQRRAIIEAYNARYGTGPGGMTLDEMLADELGEMDHERATQLAENGRLDPVFAMRYAMDGIGTDEDMMRDALANLSPDEAAQLQRDYAQRYGSNLEEDMRGELSGRDEHYITQSLGGERDLPIEERLRRADSSYDFERGSGAGIFGGFTDVFFDAGEQLDADHERLGRARAALEAADTPEARAAAEAEVNRVLGYETSTREAYHAAQDSVANNAAMAGAIVATVAVTAAPGGLGAGAAVPALASFMGSAAAATGIGATSLAMGAGALAGGLVSMGIKRSISGEAYGDEAAGFDLAMTGVNALTAGAMASGAAVQGLPALLASRGVGTFSATAGGSFANTMATQLVQGAAGGLVSGTAAGLLDERTWRGPGNGALDFLSTVGSSVASNMAGGAAQTLVGSAVGSEGLNLFDPDTIAGSAATGFFGGAAGGAAQTLMTPGAFDNRWEDVALRFGNSMGSGGVQGGLMNAVQAHSANVVRAENAASDALPTPDAAPAAEAAPISNPAESIPSDVIAGLPPEVADVIVAAQDNPPVPTDAPAVAPAELAVLSPEVATTIETAAPAVDAAREIQAAQPDVPAAAMDVSPALSADGPTLPPVNEPPAPAGGGGGGGGASDAADAGDRAALVELSRQAHTPEERATIAGWAAEIDAANPAPMREALAALHVEANADGVITGSEGAALHQWDSESARLPAAPGTPDSQTVFDLARAANGAKTVDPALSADIPGVLASADAARVGADPALQSQRAAFESALAMSPATHEAITPTMDAMGQKVLDYLSVMHGDSLDASLSMLGEHPSQRNYAGAVGNDPETIRAVLEGGNVRERMVAMAEFQERILGDAVLREGGIEEMRARFADREDGAFTMADIDRLEARRAAYLESIGPDGRPSAKGLFTPFGDDHAGYAAAKAEGHDTKLPSFTPEAVTAMGIEGVTAPTRVGEGSILARSELSIDAAQELGLGLSPREIAQAATVDPEGGLPWVVGSRANMVQPDAPFITAAREASMPLKAGISGTTARAMGLFDVLGADPAMARLALTAHLTSIEAHSFHEIASASNGYFPDGSGARYNVAQPYTPESLGLPPEVLAAIAEQAGVSIEELNRSGRR